MSVTPVRIETVSDLDQLSIGQRVRDSERDTWRKTGSGWSLATTDGSTLMMSSESLLNIWAPLLWLQPDPVPGPPLTLEQAQRAYEIDWREDYQTAIANAFRAGWEAKP